MGVYPLVSATLSSAIKGQKNFGVHVKDEEKPFIEEFKVAFKSHLQHHTSTSSALPKDGNPRIIPSEEVNILLHPLKS